MPLFLDLGFVVFFYFQLMQKILSYPLTVIFIVLYFLTLITFHPLQWLSLKLFGHNTHQKVVALMNLMLMGCTMVLGTTYKFTNTQDLPEDTPLILVCNHQSMYDISPISWHLRKHYPKFISKKELGKGIPSVSFNLKYGGSVLIERNNPRQSLPAIMNFGEYIEKTKRAAVIFPEGTRSRNGKPKSFQPKGLEILFKKAPSAFVVPITINNSWKMQRFGKFPLGLGSHISFMVHKPIKVANFTDKQALISQIENTITESIIQ